jgi:hypothetical protein
MREESSKTFTTQTQLTAVIVITVHDAASSGIRERLKAAYGAGQPFSFSIASLGSLL